MDFPTFNNTALLLHRRGQRYLRYLITDYFIPVVMYQVLYKLLGFIRVRSLQRVMGMFISIALLVTLITFLNILIAVMAASAFLCFTLIATFFNNQLSLYHNRRLARKVTRDALANPRPGQFNVWTEVALEPPLREAIQSERRANPGRDILIGWIDQDGLLHGRFGELSRQISDDISKVRSNKIYRVELCIIDDKLLVCKDYRRHRAAFIVEWLSLALLQGKANVPVIHHVDEERRRIYQSLVVASALDIHWPSSRADQAFIDGPPSLDCLPQGNNAHALLLAGETEDPRPEQKAPPPGELLHHLERQLNIIHSCGLTSLDKAFESVTICHKTGTPWLTNFDGVLYHRSTSSLLFTYRRNQDRVQFNRRFNAQLFTEESARKSLAREQAKLSAYRDYAPINFGNGLKVNSLLNIDSGTGRWEFLNKHVVGPIVQGSRVLDLGSNNGSMPLMMLRSGAREVIGVEKSKKIAHFARLNHRIFEWRDMRSYDLQLMNCDMLQVLQADWGVFDVVTAFCSLYYLDEEDMARIVRRCSKLAAVMILQGNTAFAKGEERSRKASVEFLAALLQHNGFPYVEVSAPSNYSRKLLVGRRDRSRAGESAHKADTEKVTTINQAT